MSPLSRYMPSTSYRWRSEPQIAVDVTRTMASVGSWIFGSGTVSTDTLDVPCQVSARMLCASDSVSSRLMVPTAERDIPWLAGPCRGMATEPNEERNDHDGTDGP